MKIVGILLLVAAILAGIGYSYKATWNAGDSNGYGRRVGEESKANHDAEEKGRKAQEAADADTIGQLRQALADDSQSAKNHQRQLDAINRQNADLTERLKNAKSNPDAARWLVEPIPAAILASVCWTPPGTSPSGACPGH